MKIGQRVNCLLHIPKQEGCQIGPKSHLHLRTEQQQFGAIKKSLHIQRGLSVTTGDSEVEERGELGVCN